MHTKVGKRFHGPGFVHVHAVMLTQEKVHIFVVAYKMWTGVSTHFWPHCPYSQGLLVYCMIDLMLCVLPWRSEKMISI